MPSSQFAYIKKVLKLIKEFPHESILDIGPGFGKYGVLCREYFDLVPTWFKKNLSGFDRENWQLRIDCIEPFEPYITPLHRYIYDNIYIGKAEDVLPGLDKYDLILMIGVLEHLNKEDGAGLLAACSDKGKATIIVTPSGFNRQPSVWGNPYEEHKSGWTQSDLAELGFKSELVGACKIIAHQGTKKEK